MWILNFKSGMLAALITAFISGSNGDYSHLEGKGVNCPSKDSCAKYKNNLTYMDRSCECDRNCTAYQDCCIDARALKKTQSATLPARTDIQCLHYGAQKHTGIYAISECSIDWNGPRQVREKCIGSTDFTDPLSAAPTTDAAQKKTYRNRACAECNDANMASLTTFQLKLSCHGLLELTEEQIMADMVYNEQLSLWGIYRLKDNGNGTQFVGCDIIFDVPEYLNSSVRFCRSNIISKCAADWTRPVVAKMCAQYMAIVYSNNDGYRNPDCAVCNYETLDGLSCNRIEFARRRTISFAAFVDINQSDGVEEVGRKKMTTPKCPSNQIYDPFNKICKQLACALPSYDLVNGKCVAG